MQEKLDFVLPIATMEFGMTGVSMSVAIVCDGLSTPPGEEAYTVGDGVFWPHEVGGGPQGLGGWTEEGGGGGHAPI